jgi:hypothetical protein
MVTVVFPHLNLEMVINTANPWMHIKCGGGGTTDDLFENQISHSNVATKRPRKTIRLISAYRIAKQGADV